MEASGDQTAEVAGTVMSFFVVYGIWIIFAFLILFLFTYFALWLPGKKSKQNTKP